MKLKANEILVLRNVKENMTSKNNFKWPKKGPVEAPDWNLDYNCGCGLHGLPWGVGDTNYFYLNPSVWLVVKVSTDKNNYRYGKNELIDKCKFKKGYVLFHGSRDQAVSLIQKYAPPNLTINFTIQRTENDNITQTAGNDSTQTAGDNSTQTAGDNSTQTAEWNSTQKAEGYSTQTAGWNSTQIAGGHSTQKAGDNSTQTAGWNSTQKAGGYSTQKAGGHSTQKAGNDSTQTAGNYSIQTAGIGTVQIIRDEKRIIKTRTITKRQANIPYIIKDGRWYKIKKSSIK